MIKLLLVALFLIFVFIFSGNIVSNNSEIYIKLYNYSIQMNLISFVICILLALFLGKVLFYILNMNNIFKKIFYSKYQRRNLELFISANKNLVMKSGDQALKELNNIISKKNKNSLTEAAILNALFISCQNDSLSEIKKYEKLITDKAQSFDSFSIIADYYYKKNNFLESLDYLNKIKRSLSNHEKSIQICNLKALGKWDELTKISPKLIKDKLITREESQLFEINKFKVEILDLIKQHDLTKIKKFRNSLPKNIKNNPSITNLYIDGLIENHQNEEAYNFIYNLQKKTNSLQYVHHVANIKLMDYSSILIQIERLLEKDENLPFKYEAYKTLYQLNFKNKNINTAIKYLKLVISEKKQKDDIYKLINYYIDNNEKDLAFKELKNLFENTIN
ncbi:hypothetical protein [Paraphotobacterium marinum]|uniref:hypothetical protein n=1 Tax=Paraphotobacterium marinum TaxID=1755811 RepID=UPI0039ECA481